MWRLRYINGFGELVETEFHALDAAYAHLQFVFDENEGPFSFKLTWVPKHARLV